MAGAVVEMTPFPVVSMTPVPVPVPRGREVVEVPLDHDAVVFMGYGTLALVVVRIGTVQVVSITPVPVVKITPVPVPSGKRLVDVPLYHEAVVL